ncbi:MAG TPA: SsgA family sporulation/cell division regulator [Actinomycetota bacterium]|nr:SsgA family sporulation/cell division regulator [Actinomycetota bacterium]
MHTGPIPVIVCADVVLNLVTAGEQVVLVPASFTYSAHEPLSVIAEFHGAGSTVRWVFARDLLQQATAGPVGEGDVTCWPAMSSGEPVLCLSLRSPSGHALLEAPAEEISDFLRRSYEVIPAGEEAQFLDIDGLIADLLGEPNC